jgi:hypothetical protein
MAKKKNTKVSTDRVCATCAFFDKASCYCMRRNEQTMKLKYACDLFQTPDEWNAELEKQRKIRHAKEEKRLNLILTALHISATTTQQILEFFDDQFIDHKTESDWRFEKKAAANEMVKLCDRIRTIHQHTFMKDINRLLTNDGTEPYDYEKFTRHEDNGRRQARRLIMECGKLLSDEAEDKIDAMYESFPDPGFCVRKDYDHFIRKH